MKFVIFINRTLNSILGTNSVFIDAHRYIRVV